MLRQHIYLCSYLQYYSVFIVCHNSVILVVASLLAQETAASDYEDVCDSESVFQLDSLNFNRMTKVNRVREIEKTLATMEATRSKLERELNVTQEEACELEASIEQVVESAPQLEELQSSHTCESETPRDCCEVCYG